jgi:apolipoprotein D and lipocalin family protein
LRRLILCLVLAACAKPVPPPIPTNSFRDVTLPIGSTTRGGPYDMAGNWRVAAAYPGGIFGPGDGVVLDFAADGTGVLNGLPLQVTMPNRWIAGGVEYWVLWVDDDFRTAVIGTPTGAFGWIMDRPGAASVDRTRAAREVLDFSGYDLGQLEG